MIWIYWVVGILWVLDGFLFFVFPALVRSLFIRAFREGRFLTAAKRAYAPVVRWAVHWRHAVVVGAVVLFGASLLLFRSLGQEFAPTLSELDILVHAIRIPSTSVSQRN